MKRHVDDLLPAYLNGTLGQNERDRVDAHLATCEQCRAALNEWRSIGTATRSALVDSGAAPVGSLDRLWAAIDGPSKDRPKARRARPLADMTTEEMQSMSSHALSPKAYAMPRRIPLVPWMTAVAAVLLVTMAAFAWYSMNPGGSNGPEPMPAVQLASNATPEQVSCPGAPESRDLTLTGTPEGASAINLPKEPYEGGLHVRPEDLPSVGEAADEATVAAISRTVAELTACVNARNVDAIWALTTDDYVRRESEIGRDLSDRDARAVVSMVGLVDLETPVPDLRNAIVLEDGRVGAEIQPSFDAPAGSFDYYVFAEKEGRWLIDEAVHVQDYGQIEVTVDDSGFAPRDLTVPAQLSELVLTNEGTTNHSMVIAGYGTRIEAAPGETATVVLKGPAGMYEFMSDIPGDDLAEFSGTINFEGEPQPEGTPAPVGSTPLTGSRELGMATASATIHLEAPETYSPDRLAILADRDVEITLVNDGKLDANFTIDALEISVDLAPGESETVTINAPEGAYAFYSTIPGHAQVGMTGVLMVQAESGQP